MMEFACCVHVLLPIWSVLSGLLKAFNAGREQAEPRPGGNSWLLTVANLQAMHKGGRRVDEADVKQRHCLFQYIATWCCNDSQ
jgi:hypothetical protein